MAKIYVVFKLPFMVGQPILTSTDNLTYFRCVIFMYVPLKQRFFKIAPKTYSEIVDSRYPCRISAPGICCFRFTHMTSLQKFPSPERKTAQFTHKNQWLVGSDEFLSFWVSGLFSRGELAVSFGEFYISFKWEVFSSCTVWWSKIWCIFFQIRWKSGRSYQSLNWAAGFLNHPWLFLWYSGRPHVFQSGTSKTRAERIFSS